MGREVRRGEEQRKRREGGGIFKGGVGSPRGGGVGLRWPLFTIGLFGSDMVNQAPLLVRACVRAIESVRGPATWMEVCLKIIFFETLPLRFLVSVFRERDVS